MKSPQEIEFLAGMVMAQLQKQGCTPHEATEVALTLVAYVIDTQSQDKPLALSAAQEFLRVALSGSAPS